MSLANWLSEFIFSRIWGVSAGLLAELSLSELFLPIFSLSFDSYFRFFSFISLFYESLEVIAFGGYRKMPYMSLKVFTETWFFPAEIAGSPIIMILFLPPVRLLQVDPEP